MFKFGKSSKHRKFDFFVHVCLFLIFSILNHSQRHSTMTLADREASWEDDIPWNQLHIVGACVALTCAALYAGAHPFAMAQQLRVRSPVFAIICSALASASSSHAPWTKNLLTCTHARNRKAGHCWCCLFGTFNALYQQWIL